MSESIDEKYKSKFITKTQKLLDEKISETYKFIDASLNFQKGNAIWKQDLMIIDINKPKSSKNPLINPEIPVKSAEHTYNLLKKYYTEVWFSKNNAFERGRDNLEAYCND